MENGMDQKPKWLVSEIKGCQNSQSKAEMPCVPRTMKNYNDEPEKEF